LSTVLAGILQLLLRLGIKARACLPLFLHQLGKAGQNEFAVLFSRFVSQSAERIEKYSSSLLIGLGYWSWLLRQERVEVLFWSSLESFMKSNIGRFQGDRISPPPPSPSPAHYLRWLRPAEILVSF
jgi:hypothetical protein